MIFHNYELSFTVKQAIKTIKTIKNYLEIFS